MMRRSLASALLCISMLMALTASAAATDLAHKVEVSTEIYTELYGDGEPSGVIGGAVCIAVFPHVIKGAFGFGGHRGGGIISCRDDGKWSPPAFLKMTGGSFGLQIGGEVSDIVLFFMTRRGIESLLQTKFTLGGEAGVAAGPYGHAAQADTDLKFKAEIYAYGKSRGLFVGVSLEGARVAVNQKAIRKYYGKKIWAEEILFEHQVPTIPSEARKFMQALPDGD